MSARTFLNGLDMVSVFTHTGHLNFRSSNIPYEIPESNRMPVRLSTFIRDRSRSSNLASRFEVTTTSSNVSLHKTHFLSSNTYLNLSEHFTQTARCEHRPKIHALPIGEQQITQSSIVLISFGVVVQYTVLAALQDFSRIFHRVFFLHSKFKK